MTLPAGLLAAFRLAAAELGMCSAARLFTEELTSAGGSALLSEAREAIGDDFPVFDLLAQEALDGHAPRAIDASAAAAALGNAQTVLVVGLEAYFLDALVPRLEGRRVGLILGEGGLEGDTRRVLANFGGRVEEARIGEVQRWAGNRSTLMTFLYGARGPLAYVAPTWLRVAGSDVRTQFRTLMGWDVLGRPTTLYPRWLVETPVEAFSKVVGP